MKIARHDAGYGDASPAVSLRRADDSDTQARSLDAHAAGDASTRRDDESRIEDDAARDRGAGPRRSRFDRRGRPDRADRRGRRRLRQHPARHGARQGIQRRRGHARRERPAISRSAIAPTPSRSTSRCPTWKGGRCSIASSTTRPRATSRCTSSPATTKRRAA